MIIPISVESDAVAGTRTQLSALPLAAYRSAVALDEPVRPTAAPATAARLDAHVRSALHLLSADPTVSRLGLRADSLRHLADAGTARRMLRALLTVRDPGPLPEGAERELDALLGAERRLRPAVSARELPTVAEEFHGTAFRAPAEAVLWRGGVTTLAADAVVNAANSRLLGCFRPLGAVRTRRTRRPSPQARWARASRARKHKCELDSRRQVG
ncbi:hypothetical protein [Streptomyces sp. 3214.6]|uniref:hypothetical protein n=1 Tax=Streptomyces sp. 3214.6 TaxID=1882757 RepID=UPI000909A06C|nr:hypothetical protein [Streptomyces sp. 3214.6]SHH69280.1 hypothetical protein SAMN05444521_1451 [Streptomyces sp. 3214.6]